MKRSLFLLVLVCLCGWPGQGVAQSSRSGWGSIPYADETGTGVAFRVWAPGATGVSVVGSFNGWNTAANPLALENATSGVWSADVATARTNDNYKYMVNGKLWRSDPRARSINSSDHGNSVVVATDGFDWGDDAIGIDDAHALVIYEAHVGTFAGPTGTFASFTNRLDYLSELGVNAIELMPINEYPTTTSWGYNPAYPFALEYDYGSPGDLKNLVKQAHARGMQVLLDVVHNHWDRESSLWQFDTTNNPGPYFYSSAPYADTWWGPRPDYGRAEVQEYVFDNFRMWLDEYHLDGFRWDTPKYIFFTTNGIFNPDGWTLVAEALDRMRTDHPTVWNVAENGREYQEDFDAAWDLTFSWKVRSALTNGSDSRRDMDAVASNVVGTAGRILYTDSHDTAGDLNGGARLPTAIQRGDPEGYFARKRSALGAVLAMTSPGTPMILQGQELLETNQFGDTRPMDWTRTNSQAGTWRLYRDLIRLRRNLDGVSQGLLGDAAQVYQVDNADKWIAYGRQDGGTAGAVVVVANFANAARTGLVVRFPREGMWYSVFNGDSTTYAADYGDWGSLDVAAAGSPALGTVDVAPYSAIVFSQTPMFGMVPGETSSDDRFGGNGDGVLDPGETIREEVVLWNKSTLPATGVVATLSSLTPGATVVRDESAYDAMEAGGRATNRDEFVYRLDPSLACGSAVRFRIVAAFNGQARTNVFSHVVGKALDQPPATNDFGVWTATPIPDDSTVYSDLEIAEAEDPVVADVDVWVRIKHAFDWDLTLALQHPDGTEVLLVKQRGSGDDDFGTGECGSATYAVLDQAAAVSIAEGAAPFAGTYRPETSLDVLNGKPLNGTWRLRMEDAYPADSGTNLCWGIRAVSEQRICECEAFSNRAPVARSTNLWLSVPGPTNFALDGSDEDGQPLDFLTVSPPVHGRFTWRSAVDGQAAYAPVHGFVGTDAVDFAVSDGFATSAVATATFVVPAPVDVNSNGLPDDWEMRYWTNLTSALPEEDSDGDGVPNGEERLANTDPRDDQSALRLLSLDPGAETVLRWRSIGGTRYRVQVNEDSRLESFRPLVRPLDEEVDPSTYGTPSIQTFIDGEPAPTNRSRIYRIRVLAE